MTKPLPRIPRALTIAGSDSGGGAGIQADLKAFARAGVHGMSAITAITAQNTVEVRAVHPIPPEMVVAQVAAVVDDIGVDAVKIGMLGGVPTIEAVAQALDLLPEGTPVVLDPVMVAESGAVLLAEDARGALVELILPRVEVVTPNIPEARVLSAVQTDDAADLAVAVRGLGVPVAVVTGGHSESGSDWFVADGEPIEIPGERADDGAAHGSGCTHSATLAAHLAHGADPFTAATHAKRAATEAVARGLRELGEGAGPVDVIGLGPGARPHR